MSLIYNNTPFEVYNEIIVKREDLSCPLPGPCFSKIRGIEKTLLDLKNKLIPPEVIGVVDTVHSKAGWGVSYLCKNMGFRCVVFYPHFVREEKDFVRFYQKKCREVFGAEIIPIQATKSSVLFYKARKILKDKYINSFLMPNGLKLDNTIIGTCSELRLYTLKKYLTSDFIWVVSASSGTIAAGVIRGLALLEFKGKVIIHLGYSRPEENLKKYLFSGFLWKLPFELHIIDEKYEYKDLVKYPCPFPCNPYYDLKAWKWLMENKDNLEFKNNQFLFWNIGA